MVDTDTYSPELLSRNLPLSSNITPKSWSVPLYEHADPYPILLPPKS